MRAPAAERVGGVGGAQGHRVACGVLHCGAGVLVLFLLPFLGVFSRTFVEQILREGNNPSCEIAR